jgi:hypothetical protein
LQVSEPNKSGVCYLSIRSRSGGSDGSSSSSSAAAAAAVQQQHCSTARHGHYFVLNEKTEQRKNLQKVKGQTRNCSWFLALPLALA